MVSCDEIARLLLTVAIEIAIETKLTMIESALRLSVILLVAVIFSPSADVPRCFMLMMTSLFECA